MRGFKIKAVYDVAQGGSGRFDSMDSARWKQHFKVNIFGILAIRNVLRVFVKSSSPFFTELNATAEVWMDISYAQLLCSSPLKKRLYWHFFLLA